MLLLEIGDLFKVGEKMGDFFRVAGFVLLRDRGIFLMWGKKQVFLVGEKMFNIFWWGKKVQNFLVGEFSPTSGEKKH